MGEFGLWQFVLQFVPLLLIAALVLGVGRWRSSMKGVVMKSTQASKPGAAVLIFIIGTLAGMIAFVIGTVATSGRGVERAIDMIAYDPGPYVLGFMGSGIAWVLLFYALSQLGKPTSVIAWVGQIVAATLLLGPIGQAFAIALRVIFLDFPAPPSSYLENPRTWFGYLDTPPYNLLMLARATILVALTFALRSATGGSAAAGTERWSPGPMAGRGPDEVTRILCGNALLSGGTAFRHRVLSFFRDKWIAAAPEFGLDVRLLVAVCLHAEAREKRYHLAFAAAAIIGLLISVGVPALGLPLAILVTGGIWFTKTRRGERLARSFSQASFSRAAATETFGAALERDIADAMPREDQNLVVYSGFLPFVGAGLDLGGWSFVTFVDKPKVKGATESIETFTVRELHAALDAAIGGLRLPNLRLRDYFFVRGLDIRGDSEILGDLANRPQQILATDLGALYMEEQDTRIRSYKCLQVVDWGGELIVSYYLRCSLQGSSLLVELKRYLLPPLAEEHRRIDRLPRDRLGRAIGQGILSSIVGPLLALVSPFILLGRFQEGLANLFLSEERRARIRRQTIEDNPAYDYGATTTLRASLAQHLFLHYFQKSDADFDNKVIERKLLDEIERFLDERGIDTSDIRDRQTTILNSGILVQGGDVRAESLAVGQGAQASKVESPKAAKSKETVG